jgi:hypothetical protein
MMMVASAIATAETNEALKRRKRIRSPSLFNAGGCLAQPDWRCYPIGGLKRQRPSTRSATKPHHNATKFWNVWSRAA